MIDSVAQNDLELVHIAKEGLLFGCYTLFEFGYWLWLTAAIY